MRASSPSHTETEGFLTAFAGEDAFRAWYERTLPSVYAFVLYRCGGVESVAMDITQEAFVEAIRARDRFDGRSTPLTWICGIARHRLADHYRRLAREERRSVDLVADGVDGRLALDGWEAAADAREDVLRTLRVIPPAQGIALALHYLDGLSVREIAERMDRTEKAVESLLRRGRDAFRSEYARGSEGDTGG